MNSPYQYVEYLNANRILINLDYVPELNRPRAMVNFVESKSIDETMKGIDHVYYRWMYILKSFFDHWSQSDCSLRLRSSMDFHLDIKKRTSSLSLEIHLSFRILSFPSSECHHWFAVIMNKEQYRTHQPCRAAKTQKWIKSLFAKIELELNDVRHPQSN